MSRQFELSQFRKLAYKRQSDGDLWKFLSWVESLPDRTLNKIGINFTGHKKRQTRISVDSIIATVAKYYDIDIVEMFNGIEEEQLIEIREITVYLLRTLLNMSYSDIAKQVRFSDSSSALVAARRVQQKIEDKEEGYHTKIKKITKAIQART